eukprot:GHVT01089847.1.p1 GENE.GHVT01089847.1~~GHVT01089847.1.p1  ORF type:complete len:816 (-),score=156.83 GHVT01089847.1:4931-7378(-)
MFSLLIVFFFRGLFLEGPVGRPTKVHRTAVHRKFLLGALAVIPPLVGFIIFLWLHKRKKAQKQRDSAAAGPTAGPELTARPPASPAATPSPAGLKANAAGSKGAAPPSKKGGAVEERTHPAGPGQTDPQVLESPDAGERDQTQMGPETREEADEDAAKPPGKSQFRQRSRLRNNAATIKPTQSQKTEEASEPIEDEGVPQLQVVNLQEEEIDSETQHPSQQQENELEHLQQNLGEKEDETETPRRENHEPEHDPRNKIIQEKIPKPQDDFENKDERENSIVQTENSRIEPSQAIDYESERESEKKKSPQKTLKPIQENVPQPQGKNHQEEESNDETKRQSQQQEETEIPSQQNLGEKENQTKTPQKKKSQQQHDPLYKKTQKEKPNPQQDFRNTQPQGKVPESKVDLRKNTNPCQEQDLQETSTLRLSEKTPEDDLSSKHNETPNQTTQEKNSSSTQDKSLDKKTTIPRATGNPPKGNSKIEFSSLPKHVPFSAHTIPKQKNLDQHPHGSLSYQQPESKIPKPHQNKSHYPKENHPKSETQHTVSTEPPKIEISPPKKNVEQNDIPNKDPLAETKAKGNENLVPSKRVPNTQLQNKDEQQPTPNKKSWSVIGMVKGFFRWPDSKYHKPEISTSNKAPVDSENTHHESNVEEEKASQEEALVPQAPLQNTRLEEAKEPNGKGPTPPPVLNVPMQTQHQSGNDNLLHLKQKNENGKENFCLDNSRSQGAKGEKEDQMPQSVAPRPPPRKNRLPQKNAEHANKKTGQSPEEQLQNFPDVKQPELTVSTTAKSMKVPLQRKKIPLYGKEIELSMPGTDV